MPHENNMIAKTITDFAFGLIKAIPIIITIAYKSSNKKQYSSSGAKVVFTRRIFKKQLKYEKETSLVEKGVAWRTEELSRPKSLTEDFQIRFVRV